MATSDDPGPLPDFLIVGAAKAGTTSLATWLRDHPQVHVPDQKELQSLYERCKSGAMLTE